MANELPTNAFRNEPRSLTTSEYIALLTADLDDLHTTSVPPVFAKPGELYIYHNLTSPNDWKADGYRWKDNGKFTTKDNLRIKYYKPHTGNGFFRKVYSLGGSCTPVIIHYTGSLENVEHLCHGNMKKHVDEKFVRTAPSQLEAQKVDLNKNPSSKYVNLVTAEVPPVVATVLLPRNKKQVSNTTTNERDRRLPSKDDVLGLHEVYREIGGFLALNEAPEFFVVYCSEGSTALFNKVAKIDGCILFYDTTFNIGDFYVSPLIYHNPIFKPSPVIPIAYIIHHNKTLHVHKHFFYLMKNKLPVIANCIIVTDREQAIVKAISDELPNAKHFVCWNHLQRDVKFWLRKHKNSTPGDEETYSSHVWDLLSSNSETECLIKKSKMAEHWSQEFLKYFDKELSSDVMKSGKWALKAVNIYTEGSGITSNSAESFNAVLKRCTEQKEMKMSVFLLCVYKIDLFFQKEIIRGTCGCGDYKLSDQFKSKFLIDPANATFPESVYPLDQIPYVLLDRHVQLELPVESEALNSTQALVKSYITENRIKHVPSEQVFIVDGWNGKYLVNLFPKENCSCVAKVDCIHLKAVRHSVGLPVSTQKDVKLSNIMRRDRGKRSGRKGGGRKLVVVEAADDGDISTGKVIADDAIGANSVLVPVKAGNVIKNRFYHPSIHDPDSESFIHTSLQYSVHPPSCDEPKSEPCDPHGNMPSPVPPPKKVRFNVDSEPCPPLNRNSDSGTVTDNESSILVPVTIPSDDGGSYVSWNADQVTASTPTSKEPLLTPCSLKSRWNGSDHNSDDDDDGNNDDGDEETQCMMEQDPCYPVPVPPILALPRIKRPAIFSSDVEDNEDDSIQPIQYTQCQFSYTRPALPKVGCAMCSMRNVLPPTVNAPMATDIDDSCYSGQMACLRSEQWLSGTVVEEAIDRLIRKYKKQDSVVQISFVQEMSKDLEIYDRYRNVLRAATNVEALNKDFVLTVMNVDEKHWLLGVVCFVSKCVVILDSFNEDLNSKNKLLAKLLMKLAYCCHLVAGAPFDESRWKVGSYELKMKQPNAVDCGLFVIYHATLFLDQDQRVFSEIALDSKGSLLASREGRRNIYNLFQEDIPLSSKCGRKPFVLNEIMQQAQILDNFDPRLKFSKTPLTLSYVWSVGVKNTCAGSTGCFARQNEGFYNNSAYNAWAMCVVCRKWWHGPCMEITHHANSTTYYVCRRCL